MTSAAEDWTRKRNLSVKSERETLIYLLGRIGRETIPQDLLIFFALRFPGGFLNLSGKRRLVPS